MGPRRRRAPRPTRSRRRACPTTKRRAGEWKVFTKAGQPGWAVLIPIYNIYVTLKTAGKPGWWLILAFIPIANVVVAILIPIGIVNDFGKGAGFGLGLLFLGFIFYPILAFGDAQYQG
jgi:hypothetical protein